MGDSAMTVFAGIIAVIVLGVFPLIAMANQTDKTANQTAQAATTDFVNNIRTTGIIKLEDYNNFLGTLTATGNSYKAEIVVQILDENPAKKSGSTVIGDNVYYTMYTTQVMDELSSNTSHTKQLKEGDIVSVSVENTNITIAQQLRNFIYKVTGNSSSTITAEASGMVTTTGESY